MDLYLGTRRKLFHVFLHPLEPLIIMPEKHDTIRPLHQFAIIVRMIHVCVVDSSKNLGLNLMPVVVANVRCSRENDDP